MYKSSKMPSAETIVTTTTIKTATAITTLAPSLEGLTAALSHNFVHYLNYLDRLPGGQIILRYIKSSYKNDPVRSLFELALFIFAVHYFLSSKKKENKSDLTVFSEKEIDALCKDWEPEPLVEDLTPLEKWELKCIPEIKGHNGSHVQLLNEPGSHLGKVVNLASYDFLNLNESDNIKAAAKGCISGAGVGACGPPNFYGTQDVHVRLEEDLSEYLGTEQAILYGQDFVTAGSVIPAYLKRGDLCIVDSGVNLAIQKALIVSRCDLEWYDHNDMDHLEQILKEIKPVIEKQKPIRRRFVVTESLFATTGDLALLPRIVELKNKYKYRLFLDESLSIGVLGATGKGLVEHYNIPRSEISITIGSMALSFASSGGFCVGVTPMIQHQRISSNAYVFSAALPPYSAKVTSEAIKEISSNLDSTGKSKLMLALHEKIQYVYQELEKQIPSSFFAVTSAPFSPIIHLSLSLEYRKKLNLPPFYGNTDLLLTGKQSKRLNEFNHKLNTESFILQKIIDQCLTKAGVLLTRSKHILEHENLPVPSPHLLFMVNTGVSIEEFNRAIYALKLAMGEVCSKIRNENDLLVLENEIINY